jgi:hypothetical protein
MQSRRNGERGTTIPHQIFLDEELLFKKIRQGLASTLGFDA